MKTDKYTKFLLTIIALCLLNLTFKGVDLFPQAYAVEAPNKSSMEYALVPLNEDGSITVRLSSMDEIDVNITNISTSDELSIDLAEISTSDELDVNLEEIGGGFINTSEGIPVKIKN